MPRGTPIVGVRMPSSLRREIERVVARSIHYRRREPYTLSSYVIDAVRAKLDHAERSRRPRRRKRRKVYLQL